MLSVAEIPVMGLLAERAMHGYDLDREMELSGLRGWMPVSKVAIYKALGRLAENGCLDMRTDRNGNLPERTVYSLTRQGRQRLRDLVCDAIARESPLESLTSLALYFAGEVPVQDILAALDVRRAFLARQIEILEAQASLLSDVQADMQALLRRHDLDRYNLEMVWIGDVIQLLAK